MDHLLPHYERELALLRASVASFSARYPKIAVRLGINGDRSEDPHIERMLQSFALLAANIDNRIGDAYPEFTHALIGMLCPQYLRPIPACTVARFDTGNVFDTLTEPSLIPRGTELSSKAEDCRFRTVYDVTLAPICIENARYGAVTNVPSHAVLPPGTSGLLSITFAVTRPGFRIASIPVPLRVHIDGADEVVATILDSMTMRTAAAFVEDAEHRWTALQASPVAPVGYADTERLIEEDDGAPALRLLGEYFAYAKKFDFVDIDLPALTATAQASPRLTLHLAIHGVHPDSREAQRLAPLSADHLKLFCTPIVNLFRLTSVPLKRDPLTGTYPVQSQNTDAAQVTIWSVDTVRATNSVSRAAAIPPFTSLMHGGAGGPTGPYWLLAQGPAAPSTGKAETALSLVGLDGRPASDTGIEQITANMTCTNGDLPRTLRTGAPNGDLVNEQGAIVSRIDMLDSPSAVAHLPLEGDAVWRLTAQLAPHSIELTRTGLVALKRLLRQFALQSGRYANLIDGLTDLGHRVKQLWLPREPIPSFVRGLEVTLTVDERVFAATSLNAFVGVMERFFTAHMSATNFVQLVVMSANTGREIRRCMPRPGATPAI
ncbi:type VI secretion system baseplate subunit TssF [Burkholderia anthina]|uniref:type VI secretion system baseplate subunit TssF n=1 Tax=Burkholderia anthina TaxID=179879 RepID=UPI00158D291D|nr:type VI secretion system baseplate subunit TssF [Burkholderia anthina]